MLPARRSSTSGRHALRVRRSTRPAVAALTSAALAAGSTAVVALTAAAPTAHGAAGPALATVHLVTPYTAADTAHGIGVGKHPLAAGYTDTVTLAGHHGVPRGALSVTVDVVVTSAAGNGQVRVGPSVRTETPAVAVVKGTQTQATLPVPLNAGRLSFTYTGTGKVQVRLVVEAWSAGDLTGSTYHPIAALRVADTSTGRGVKRGLLPGRNAASVQIADVAGIPANADAAVVSISTVGPTAGGSIDAGATSAATTPVLTFGKRQQVTGSTLVRLSRGRLTLVNSSAGRVGLTATVLGYYTPDTTGLLFQATTATRVLTTSAKHPLSATATTVPVRTRAHLPADAEAVALSVVAPSPGAAAVSAGSSAATAITVLHTQKGRSADATADLPLATDGSVVLRSAGARPRVQVAVVGWFAPLTIARQTAAPTTSPSAQPTSAQPTTARPTTVTPTHTPTSAPRTSVPPTAPPTTTPPAVRHPSVLDVNPADGATGVDPLTTSVVCDLVLPNGGVMPGSLSASTLYLTFKNGTADEVVPAKYETSGGGDTLNISPLGGLAAFRTYTFHVTAGVTDVLGVSFQPFTSTFKTGAIPTPDNNIAFDHVDSGAKGHLYTSLTKGPDGKLYAATLDGTIFRYTIAADGTLSDEQEIDTVRTHAVAAGYYGAPMRTVLGLTFDPRSTATDLVLWITDDSAYTGVTDPNNYIPDYSDVLAELTGPDLENYQAVLTGLPRSVKDHETNSIAFGPDGALYFTQAANNAMGDPDSTWGNRPEHVLNAAVLRLDTTKLPATLPLDVRGFDDGGSYDPYATGAPLTIWATGLRNAFDLVWASNGHLYAPTNGSAAYGSAPGTPTPLPTGACAWRPQGGYSGPAVPEEKFIPTAETDFVFDVHKNKYYGHPDPARCEYVLDNGNPTAGSDPFEVGAYPVGTRPDPNYDLADVYDAGLHASADGAIQYVGTAFNGQLNGRLLVVRYSDGQDIETFDVASNGALSNRTIGDKGLTNFSAPLDVTEDKATGDLYVSELGNADIELLRPR